MGLPRASPWNHYPCPSLPPDPFPSHRQTPHPCCPVTLWWWWAFPFPRPDGSRRNWAGSGPSPWDRRTLFPSIPCMPACLPPGLHLTGFPLGGQTGTGSSLPAWFWQLVWDSLFSPQVCIQLVETQTFSQRWPIPRREASLSLPSPMPGGFPPPNYFEQLPHLPTTQPCRQTCVLWSVPCVVAFTHSCYISSFAEQANFSVPGDGWTDMGGAGWADSSHPTPPGLGQRWTTFPVISTSPKLPLPRHGQREQEGRRPPSQEQPLWVPQLGRF